MNRVSIRCFPSVRAWAGLFLVMLSVAVQGADTLNWRVGQDRVSAQIESWNLPMLLESIGAATGWEIYVEPNSDYRVAAKFKDLSTGEALQRLLGNLNYALLPRTNAPARLFIYRTSLQEATQLVKMKGKAGKDGARAIANELVLTVKPGGNAEDIARRLGGKIVGRIDELGVYRLKFDDEAAAQRGRELAAGLSDQVTVDSNYIMQRPPQAELLAASSALPFSLNPTVGGDGSKLIVGLPDTAVQSLGKNYDGFMLPSLSVFGEANSTSSEIVGHGPAMAETILKGMAAILESGNSSVRILPVDVYGNSANASSFDVAKGIYLAVHDGGATLINLSLGSEADPSYLRTIIQNASQKGVLFIASAGNDPVATPLYPAAWPEVLSVTAGDKQGNLAPYANRSSTVDVVAPGASIVNFNNVAYYVSGTSVSAAWVSGMAAGLASQTGASLADISAQIRKVLAAPASKP